MKFLHQYVLLSLVKKNKIISLLSFSAYISFQLSCLLLGWNWKEMKKGRECLLIFRVYEIKVLELKVCFFYLKQIVSHDCSF